MFDKILIANRGEIAVRVMRTARRMGVATVAVYSDADAGALHVAEADEAVHIGGSGPADSYLRGERIIAAALETGAQAIHPGYGFLSENPDFVDAVEAAGLTFIGPSAKAIRAMGLKDAAKALMAKAGVPVVPGYHGEDQEPGHLEVEAASIGYPVLIKAVAGGGGKGMRKVDDPAAFMGALESAKAEALGAFGNDAVLIEKFVEKPRHIEVQVFGDGTRAVHLYERDCSLQRRHQKVIEEAPAPGMTEEMRAAMGDAAVKAAEAIGYAGAGTIEFIVDGSDGLRTDRFWFMEMNTRLQVEHPVTEAVTGVDLVEWQLRVAAGEALPMAQDAIPLKGHAFEARLYAEDAEKGFLPATGSLTHLAFPHHARADTGVRAQDTISPFYDPMIAKIVTEGATRSEALARLSQALAETEVAGTVTNIGFLARLAAHPDFVAGDVDTGLIDRNSEALTSPEAPPAAVKVIAALAAADLLNPVPLQGFALWSSLRRSVGLAEETVVISVKAPGRAVVEISGDTHEAEWRQDQWWVDGQKAGARAVLLPGAVAVFAGRPWEFALPDPLARGAAAGAGGNVIEAPMPGLIKVMSARAGDKVAAGDRLAVLEAMKMEHTLTAPRDGVVAEVLASAGDQVEAGAALVRMEDEE